MANAVNPRDNIVRDATIDTVFANNHLTITKKCFRVEVRQLASEQQQVWSIKHRSDDGGEAAEEIPAGGTFTKGEGGYRRGLQYVFEPSDTIGFASALPGAADPITLQIKEVQI